MHNIAEEIKRAHFDIERELIELEEIMSAESMNYSNLLHVFKKILSIWNSHEKEEEEFFKALVKKNYGIPYNKILFEHGALLRYRNLIVRAFSSGSEAKIKECMQTKGKKIITLLREHMQFENEIIYRIPNEVLYGFNKPDLFSTF